MDWGKVGTGLCIGLIFILTLPFLGNEIAEEIHEVQNERVLKIEIISNQTVKEIIPQKIVQLDELEIQIPKKPIQMEVRKKTELDGIK